MTRRHRSLHLISSLVLLVGTLSLLTIAWLMVEVPA